MQDEDKTKEQLISELAELRQRFAELETQRIMWKHAEDELRESEEKYRSLLDFTEDSIYLVDRSYRYLFMNKHLLRLGLLGNQFLGQSYRSFHSSEETKEFIKKVNQVFKTGESIQYEHKSRRDGRYFLRTLTPVKELNGTTVAVTIVSKDISELKQMEEKLRTLSLTDELTGLYNRRGFLPLAEQQLKTAKRLGCRTLLLAADIDNLKRINDTFGHRQGDFALIEAANIIKATFREPDIISRIGGDEFAVLMIENSTADSKMLISRLQRECDIHNTKSGRNYELSLSIGITHCAPECSYTIEELLDRADKLMYEQKRRKHKS